MTARIVSAEEARDYIRMATPGPWAEAAVDDPSESGRMVIIQRADADRVIVETGLVAADDANLMSAAPDLAHTVVQQAERIETLRQHVAGLVKVATREIWHLNEGGCPDTLEGRTTRDSRCPACYILTVVES